MMQAGRRAEASSLSPPVQQADHGMMLNFKVAG